MYRVLLRHLGGQHNRDRDNGSSESEHRGWQMLFRSAS